jgi:hypothetical protein
MDSSLRRVANRSLSHYLSSDKSNADNNHSSSPLTAEEASQLCNHPSLVLLSHTQADDPIFNFANAAAQSTFGYSLPQFLTTPSRLSAEPLVQSERQALLDRVTKYGFIDDYEGVRVSSSGSRFLIKALVWNLSHPDGTKAGQAALFDKNAIKMLPR